MFLANYEDTGITLIEAALVSFLPFTLDKFLFPGLFSKNNFIKTLKSFRGNIWRSSYMAKQLSVRL